MDAKQIIESRNKLRSGKATYKSTCEDVADYFMPEMEPEDYITDGEELLQPNTSTGQIALQRLVSGLFSNSMALSKGSLESPDKIDMEDPQVEEWYDELSHTTNHHIAKSAFSQQFNKFLYEYCAFGGSVLYPRWNQVKKTHTFLVFPENSCFYTFDQDGDAVTMFREYKYSADQAVNEFGKENLPGDVIKAYDDYDYEKQFGFIHYMGKRHNRDETKTDSLNMPFESIHVIEDAGVDGPMIVRESGAKHFRYIVSHFYQRQGERNGRSPAIQALPVIRTLAKTVADHIDATELAMGPPVLLPDKDAAETMSLKPFEVGYADLSKGAPWVYETKASALQVNAELIEWFREEINQLFFVDLFMLLEQSKAGAKTAYETSELVAERTQAIAPIANSLGDFFRKVYYIVGHDLIADRQVEAPPEAIAAKDLQVSYTNRLDIRLKEIENVSAMEAVTQANQLVAAVEQSPYLQASVKTLEAVIAIFDAHNVDPELTRNLDDAEDELEAILEAQAQQQQAEMAAQQVKPLDLQAAPQSGSPMADMSAMIEGGAGSMIAQ